MLKIKDLLEGMVPRNAPEGSFTAFSLDFRARLPTARDAPATRHGQSLQDERTANRVVSRPELPFVDPG